MSAVRLGAISSRWDAGAGAWIGRLAHGMSRKDAKEMAEQLQPGQAALIVIGIDKVARGSRSHITKHLEGSDFDEAEREAMAAPWRRPPSPRTT
jgi:hypothetical protein